MTIEFSGVFPTFNDFVEIDQDKPHLISVFGKKGSGKSVWARSMYTSWDDDKLGIDVNGDMEPGADSVIITDPLPDSFPLNPTGEPVNLHYLADPGSPTYREDLDRAIGLGLFPKEHRTLLWIDEIGEFTTGNRTDPRMRRLLHQSRHFNTSAIMCGPRPTDVDKLIIAQSDLVVIYDLPDPDDQAKIAKIIAYPADRFGKIIAEMRSLGPHHHLVYAASKCTRSGRPQLALCDPLDLA